MIMFATIRSYFLSILSRGVVDKSILTGRSFRETFLSAQIIASGSLQLQ
jgi:hypothetical protein